MTFPDQFKNEELEKKWNDLIKIRNICNISIEEKRASKEIGSSLEADLKIQLDQKLKNTIDGIDFSEICITSNAEVSFKEDSEIIVETFKAKGNKCSICWKINELVAADQFALKVLDEIYTKSKKLYLNFFLFFFFCFRPNFKNLYIAYIQK